MAATLSIVLGPRYSVSYCLWFVTVVAIVSASPDRLVTCVAVVAVVVLWLHYHARE